MPKESEFENPDKSGHYHRDIKLASPVYGKPWRLITLSCGHTTLISTIAYKKVKDQAIFCINCTLDKA